MKAMAQCRLIIFALAIFLLAPPCLAQDYSSAVKGFSLERWEEDYSYLKDPSQRSDLWDPIKYIPLNKEGDANLSFGFQARYRYDYFNNRSFGPGVNDEDGFHLQRYLFHMDAHLGPNLRAFVQVDSSRLDGREGGPRYGDADDFDLQQGFIDLKTSDDSNPYAYLRLGRQELVYGAQRLISPDDWRNVRRSFDGAKLSVSVPNDTIDFFLVRPVLIEKEQFDNDDPGTVFAGVYNVTSLPKVIFEGNSKLELYLLALYQTRSSTAKADVDTYTLGSRFETTPKPFDFDIEADYQFGDNESSSISAWSVATEAGYTLESAAFTPRASIGLDIASGALQAGQPLQSALPADIHVSRPRLSLWTNQPHRCPCRRRSAPDAEAHALHR